MTTHYVISGTIFKAPHIRHIASLNEAITPDGKGTTLALTVCGRMLHNPQVMDNTKLLYADGTVFMTPCARCEETR